VEDFGQSHWQKSRHRRGNCEMPIFTARYYRRLWGLLLSGFPMISALRLITAAHTSDQEAADKQAWSLLPTRTSDFHALATRCDAGQPHLQICVCLLKWVGGKRACTLVTGTQDIALDDGRVALPPSEWKYDVLFRRWMQQVSAEHAKLHDVLHSRRRCVGFIFAKTSSHVTSCSTQ